MAQKQKEEILLKDLCGRLPYSVKVNITSKESQNRIVNLTANNICYVTNGWWSECKPYLFPMSSMTDELKNFLRWKLTTPKYDSFDEESLEDLLNSNIQVIHFCYEHHIDINGLIEKGLANDATGLNVYNE